MATNGHHTNPRSINHPSTNKILANFIRKVPISQSLILYWIVVAKCLIFIYFCIWRYSYFGFVSAKISFIWPNLRSLSAILSKIWWKCGQMWSLLVEMWSNVVDIQLHLVEIDLHLVVHSKVHISVKVLFRRQIRFIFTSFVDIWWNLWFTNLLRPVSSANKLWIIKFSY